MSLNPIFDRVVVRPDKSEEKTASGIIIPVQGQSKPHRGIVVAVGSGKRLEDGGTLPMQVAVGDHVLYGKYSPHEFENEGEKLLVIKEEDIIGILVD